MEKEMIEPSWSLAQVWNEELIFGRSEREPYKRDNIWASEIGRNHYERYLKMNAVKPDFIPEERILRKFEAGNFFERIIGFVLISAGILIHDNQKYEIPEDSEHLRVSVRPDFIAGGTPNWDEAKERVSKELLFKIMPNLGRIAESLIKHFSEKYPNGMKKILFEIKSLNSQVFWSKKDYLQEAYPHHILQTFTGMKATKLDEGHPFYISKDDLSVVEFAISLNSVSLNEKYEEDVKKMTKYIREGIEPPKPSNIVFDERKKLKFQYLKKPQVIEGCYTENWEIDWSMFISRITGIQGKTQKEVSAKWKKSIAEELKVKNDELKAKFKEKLNEAK